MSGWGCVKILAFEKVDEVPMLNEGGGGGI